jgi:hypothetical protein
MSPPTIWGPIIWRFIHILIESIKEEQFNNIGFQTFYLIKQICQTLPCPDCSMHATMFLSKVNFKHIKNKNDFKSLFYIFHNAVNKRKNKELFNVMGLNMYKNQSLIHAYNNFINVYTVRGNHKLMTDSFARNITIKQCKSFLLKNRMFFNIN